LANQLVAAGVAASVVNQFELIQIEVHQHMCGAILMHLVDGIGQTAFEFDAIEQASQRVVACLVG
jgi:hypothetical protein